MSFKEVTEAASRTVAKQVFALREHSPGILLVVGAAGMVGSTILACRATLKMNEVLSEAEQEVEEIEKDSKTEATATKAKKNAKLQTAIKIVRHYGPAVILGAASLAAITGSHVILKNRNTGLIAAYTILDGMHKKYRANVVADQGEEKDREYMFGPIVEKEVVDPETGLVETARGLDANAIKEDEYSGYHRMFDKYNVNWEPDYRQNRFWLREVVSHFNDVLRLRGYVFLNEVYEHLGYERTEAGQMVGWIRGAEQTGDGNGYISFGLERNTDNAVAFINGTRHDVILDFNVDGVILGKFKRM
jgi:hypothetical protein